MRHSFPELTRFITSPLARGIAYTLSRSASSEGACITVCPDGYSFIEAQGAFAIAGAMVLAPELAAGGPAGVAVDASIVAIGSLMFFAGDVGRRQAADDLAEEWSHNKGAEGDSATNYGSQIEVSDQKMYQQGQHYNKHGKDMGFGSKKEYEAGARDFIEKNKNTAEIFEGKWNASRGSQGGEIQIIIRSEGKQVIINKETGQIIDFYEGTSLEGFINIRQVQ